MTTTTTSVRKGRERSCTQCGTTFRSIRSNARFCSTQCRVSRHRGHDPNKANRLRKRLEHLGFLGPVGPWNVKNPRPVRYALLVPVSYAVDEINARYNQPTVTDPRVSSRSLKEALAATPVRPSADLTEQELRTTLRKLDIEIA